MCEFVSWIEEDNKVYYLDSKALKTKEGKSLLKYLKDTYSLCDLQGHGALRKYYPELKGKNCECTDFSTPKNFPKEIVKSIKNMEMTSILFDNTPPLGLLNKKGQAEYEKIRHSAWAEYETIRHSAWAEYKKIEQPARAEYEKIWHSAWAEYEKIEQKTLWDLFKQKKYRNKKWI